MAIDIYTPRAMMAAIERMPVVGSFLRSKFFPNEETHPTRDLMLDIYKGGRIVAPYVSSAKEGKVLTKPGYTSKLIRTPYVKSKRNITAVDTAKRAHGEVPLAPLSHAERANKLMAKYLDEGRREIERVVELQASQALITGKVTAIGKDDNEVDWTVEVDYGRDAGHTVALAAGNTWTIATVDPFANLRTWQALGRKNGFMNMTEVVMGADVITAFFGNPIVQKRQLANSRWLTRDNIDMGDFDPASGVHFIGSAEGFNFYGYDNWYEHPTTGVVTQLMPANKIIMGANSARNVINYGAIEDLQFSGGLAEAKIFPKSWDEQDPSVRWLLMQSSPLATLAEPDTTLCAQVTA